MSPRPTAANNSSAVSRLNCSGNESKDTAGSPSRRSSRQRSETPANPDHGDLATNTAMRLARYLRRPPRQIAQPLRQALLVMSVPDADREAAAAGRIAKDTGDARHWPQWAALIERARRAGIVVKRMDHEFVPNRAGEVKTVQGLP